MVNASLSQFYAVDTTKGQENAQIALEVISYRMENAFSQHCSIQTASTTKALIVQNADKDISSIIICASKWIKTAKNLTKTIKPVKDVETGKLLLVLNATDYLMIHMFITH